MPARSWTMPTRSRKRPASRRGLQPSRGCPRRGYRSGRSSPARVRRPRGPGAPGRRPAPARPREQRRPRRRRRRRPLSRLSPDVLHGGKSTHGECADRAGLHSRLRTRVAPPPGRRLRSAIARGGLRDRLPAAVGGVDSTAGSSGVSPQPHGPAARSSGAPRPRAAGRGPPTEPRSALGHDAVGPVVLDSGGDLRHGRRHGDGEGHTGRGTGEVPGRRDAAAALAQTTP